MRVIVAATAFAFGVLAFAGSAAAQTAAPAAGAAAQGYVSGPQIYQTLTKEQTELFEMVKTLKCVLCHGIGPMGNKLGKMDGVGARLSPAEIREWIEDPVATSKKLNATRKPPMTKTVLTKDQVDTLVKLISNLK